jgi:ADP-ribose pyrophosphatase YjhB (NUDIX family)
MVYRLLLKLWRVLPLPGWLQWQLVSLFTTKYLVAVAAILLNEAGQILLCEHTYRRDYPWGLPGGSLKKNEDPDRGLEREILEETGLQACVERPLLVLRPPTFHQISIIYLCHAVGGAFRPNAEVSRIRFFDFQALPEQIVPHERVIIAQAQAILQEAGRFQADPEAGGSVT